MLRSLPARLLVLCLASLVAVVFAPCPNDCSKHGTCGANSICTCYTGYTGDDCSFPLVALRANVPASGTVDAHGWIYYSLVLSAPVPSVLYITCNQTSPNSDADLYEMFGNLPSRYSYDQRDITSLTNSLINVTSIRAGLYYIGVYGFTAVSYVLQAVTVGGSSSSCPNQCSGNGKCTTNSTCDCNPGWMGNDCSAYVTQMTTGQSLTNQHVNSNKWNYYMTDIAVNSNQMAWIVNQTTVGTDCDLYLRRGQLPTLLLFDYREASNVANFALTVADPLLGAWFAGIYGYTDCSYRVTLQLAEVCPNNCSLHGSCGLRSQCNCYSGFSGLMCENMISALTGNVPVAGFVGDNTFNYFHYDAFSANALVIQMNQTSRTGDCDLYVKAGSNPTRTSFDYRDISFSSAVSLSIPNPSDRTWYIGVYGYSACQYLLAISSNSACDCSNHGHCLSNGLCSCDPNWTGPTCSQSLTSLTKNLPLHGTVNASLWTYYQFATNGSSVQISVTETSTVGAVWLYVRAQQIPSLLVYDASDTAYSASHLIVLHPTVPTQSLTYFVGVYGSYYLPASRQASFTVVANSTPF